MLLHRRRLPNPAKFPGWVPYKPPLSAGVNVSPGGQVVAEFFRPISFLMPTQSPNSAIQPDDSDTASVTELSVALGHLPARCSTKRLSASELAGMLDLSERRVNQLRHVFGWPVEGPIGLEAVAQYAHDKSCAAAATREELQSAAASQAEEIAKLFAVWKRANLPAGEIVACVINRIFDQA